MEIDVLSSSPRFTDRFPISSTDDFSLHGYESSCVLRRTRCSCGLSSLFILSPEVKSRRPSPEMRAELEGCILAPLGSLADGTLAPSTHTRPLAPLAPNPPPIRSTHTNSPGNVKYRILFPLIANVSSDTVGLFFTVIFTVFKCVFIDGSTAKGWVSAGMKGRGRREGGWLTGDGAVYDCAVLEFDRDRLVGELHEESDELHGGGW